MTTYEYIFSLQDKFSATMNRINRLQDKASSKWDKVRNKVGQFGAKFKDAAMQIPGFSNALNLIGNPFILLTAGILGVTTLLTNATTQAAAFNHEFLQLRNLNLDKTQSQLQSLNDTALNLSIEEGLNPVGVSKAFYDIQSATGLYGKSVEDITRTVGRFSIATGADLGNSINSTTKAMKAFKLGSEDIQHLLESNAKTVQVGITNFDELAKVQTEYGGAAAAAGQNVDSANKLFAGFTAVAKDSQTAATLTKTAFQGLTQKNTIDGLKGIGVNLFDAKGQMRDIDGIIRELTPKLATMSDQEFAGLTNAIGGPEGLRMLFNQLKTSGDDVVSMLDAFDRSEFSIDQALKNALKDFTTLKTVVGEQLSAAMTMLGQMILPSIVSALNSMRLTIKDMTVWFKANSEEIYKWGNTLGVVLGTITGLWLASKIGVIGYSVAAGGAMLVTKLWTAATWLLNAAINMSPIGWLKIGIVAIAGAVAWAYQEFGAFREIVDGTWSSLKTFGKIIFGSILEGVKSLITGIGSIGSALWKLVKGDWQGALDAGKKGLKDLGTAAVNLSPAGMVYNTVKGASEIAGAYKKGAAESIMRSAAADASEKASAQPKASMGSMISSGEGGKMNNLLKGDSTISKGTQAITGGGPQQRVYNINIGKLNERIEVTTNKLDEGVGEIEDKMMELLLRVVNSANYSAG